MNLLALAVRNVSRSRQRSLVTIFAMGFACSMMIVFSGLMVGMLKGSELNIVSVNTGDIQIHHYGFRDDPDLYALITNSEMLLAAIREANLTASSRLYASGLIASDESASGVQLRGVDLNFEPSVSNLNQHLFSGQWLNKSDLSGIVIGKKLARLLDVGVGDSIVFLGQTYDGYMANDEFVIRGILKSVSSTVDASGVLMSDLALRRLLSLPEGAHEIVVMRTQHDDDLSQLTERVKKIVTDELEVKNWRELMPIIARFLDTAEIQTLIMQLFTYIAVGSVVLNAILMSVFERIHQFGIMKAVGVQPWQLVLLIYFESFVQACIAALFGMVLGGGTVLYLQTYGIDMSALAGSFTFAGIALDPIWYAQLTVLVIGLPICFLMMMTFLATLYPALKAARLNPVDAIYHQ